MKTVFALRHVMGLLALGLLGGCVAERAPTNVYIIDQSGKGDANPQRIYTEEGSETTIIQKTVVPAQNAAQSSDYPKSSPCANPSSDMAIFEKRIRTDLKTIGKSDAEINAYIQNWKRENNYLC